MVSYIAVLDINGSDAVDIDEMDIDMDDKCDILYS